MVGIPVVGSLKNDDVNNNDTIQTNRDNLYVYITIDIVKEIMQKKKIGE